jgi:predicted RNase H-like nuclease
MQATFLNAYVRQRYKDLSTFMTVICGADGCKTGWVAIAWDLDTGWFSWRVFQTAHELFYSIPTLQIIAIDIPIGLPERGARCCDLKARQLLGGDRARSVFPAPLRAILSATSYEDACQKRDQIEGKKMSRQAWAIVRKVKEVDEMLWKYSELNARVREVHPEVSFYFLNRERSLQYSKKSKVGREERRNLLEPRFGQLMQAALTERGKLHCAEDDILDALVALWTAERIVQRISVTIPSRPQSDILGLRMEIIA